MTSSPYDTLIQQVASSFNLPNDLLHGQVELESSFDPDAFRYEPTYFQHYLKPDPTAKSTIYGPLGACSYGLLQILLETAMEQGFSDRPEALFIPEVGLTYGARYMAHLLELTKGDYALALQHYNGRGPMAVAYANRVYQLAGRIT